MVLIIYTHDGERQEFAFRPTELNQRDAESIEDVGGDTWDNYDDFGAKFMRDNRKAYRAALWVSMRRTNPKLKFSDLENVRVDEITIGWTDEESAAIRAEVEADEDLTDAERTERLESLGIGPVDLGEAKGKDEGSVTAIAS